MKHMLLLCYQIIICETLLNKFCNLYVQVCFHKLPRLWTSLKGKTITNRIGFLYLFRKRWKLSPWLGSGIIIHHSLKGKIKINI